MKCPSCGTTEDIKFFLRHQAESDDDLSDTANVITILCSKCGKNESYFLRDCLEDIFPAWKEAESMDGLEALAGLFGGGFSQDDFNFEDFPEATDEVVEETTEEE